MRARGWSAVVVATAALLAAGCNKSSDSRQAATAGTVAVIDLDEIARRLGSDKQMANSIAERQNALSKHLVDLAKSYSKQIQDEKAKLPGADAQQNQVTVASWEQEANNNLSKVKQQAAVDLQSHRLHLINQFRDQIKPAARRVAQARGLSVIVTKNDSVVFDYTSTADITDAVVDELLANATPAIMPAPITTATPAAPTTNGAALAPTVQSAATPVAASTTAPSAR
jgi:Skp family chaperone for outer membrane proteins